MSIEDRLRVVSLVTDITTLTSILFSCRDSSIPGVMLFVVCVAP